MSFMSFDFAIRAADAALQFQQGQGENMRQANSGAREVGNTNARSKDETNRQKVQSEFEAQAADIDAKLKERLLILAEEKKKWAAITAIAIPLVQVTGGMIDGLTNAIDASGFDGRRANGYGQMSDGHQMHISDDDITNGNTQFVGLNPDSQGRNASEGALISYDSSTGNIVGAQVNNNTQNPVGRGFSLSPSGLAERAAQDPDLRTELDRRGIGLREGNPPALYNKDNPDQPLFSQTDGTWSINSPMKEALFGGPGQPDGIFKTDAGRRLLTGPAAGQSGAPGLFSPGCPDSFAFSNVTRDSGNALVGVAGGGALYNSEIQSQMQNVFGSGSSPENIASNVETSLETSGSNITFGEGFNRWVGQPLLKPIGQAIPTLIELGKAYQKIQEEVDDLHAQLDAAKQKAAAAREKLAQLESQLATQAA